MKQVTWLANYSDIDSSIKYLIAAEFFLQIVNGAFTLSLNLYLAKQGYPDPMIADFTADRFMVVMLFALPLGLYIKGKRLRPIFLAGVLALPLVSLALLEAVAQHATVWLRGLFILWGLCFTAVAIPSLPYILRNAPAAVHTRALSLHAATWSLGLLVSGTLIFALSRGFPAIFDDKTLLQVFSAIGLAAVAFVVRMPKHENTDSGEISPKIRHEPIGRQAAVYARQLINEYDWKLIGKAVVPTTLIAVGAGLTIPFMNLFFYHRFGVNTDGFALLGSATALLVSVVTLLVPRIKGTLGYKAIPLSQAAAIASLVGLGAADFMSGYTWALPLAFFCFVVRQPLMSLANPMTSELTMYYVGSQNRELTVAIISAIWSGSWFVSSYAFGLLRAMNLHYGTIFFVTAAFYTIGVATYVLLIKDFRRRERAGLVVVP